MLQINYTAILRCFANLKQKKRVLMNFNKRKNLHYNFDIVQLSSWQKKGQVGDKF